MKRFGLIGKQLQHSFSKKYFSEIFRQLQLSDFLYENYEIDSIENIIPLIRQIDDLKGINITIPYKESVMQYLNWIDPEAKGIGAVNTIKISRHGSILNLSGFNTDVYGFEYSLQSFLRPHHRSALILGTGGSSKSVAYVFRKLGIPFHFVSRSSKQDSFTYQELNEEIIKENTVIVNTTPVGTFPELSTCPDIPYQYLNSAHLLFDLIYNPSETLFLKKGREAGAATSSGLHMLQLQADKSLEIWLNEDYH